MDYKQKRIFLVLQNVVIVKRIRDLINTNLFLKQYNIDFILKSGANLAYCFEPSNLGSKISMKGKQGAPEYNMI